jgi:hypothetical protein
VKSPSIDLLDLANRKAEKLVYGLGVQEGLIAYGSPAYNPLTGKLLEGDAIYAFDEYCRKKGVDILHDTKNGSGLTPLPLLDEAERESLFRELAEKSGAIIAEAGWDEPKGLEQVMSTIFYQR